MGGGHFPLGVCPVLAGKNAHGDFDGIVGLEKGPPLWGYHLANPGEQMGAVASSLRYVVYGPLPRNKCSSLISSPNSSPTFYDGHVGFGKGAPSWGYHHANPCEQMGVTDS